MFLRRILRCARMRLHTISGLAAREPVRRRGVLAIGPDRFPFGDTLPIVAAIAGSLDLTLVIAGVLVSRFSVVQRWGLSSRSLLRGNALTASFPPTTARAPGAAAGIQCPASMMRRGDERPDEPQAAGPSRCRRGTALLAGSMRSASAAMSESQEASQALPPRQPAPPARNPPQRTRPAEQDKPYEEVAHRTVPYIGSRVAIWAVAQLHLLFAAFVLAVPIFAFIVEAIGYKTGGRALRPARARVHEAPLGVVLADRDVRGVPDVHAHHPLSEVHELPDERVLPDLPPYVILSSSRRSSSTPTTTAGGNSIRWCISAWGSASTWWARRSCSSPTPGSPS